MPKSIICRFCKRVVTVPCRNTRDMGETDGFNRDQVCRSVLAKLGGERGET